MGQENGTSTSGQPVLDVPRHVAIIMDGNGRWAKRRFLPRVEGHRAGTKAVRNIVEECRRLGVGYLTLFAFSTENWQRPKDEVSALMKLFAHFLESELKLLIENGIRLRTLGDISRLPDALRITLQNAVEATKDFSALNLVLAVSYGGRDEIVRATKKIAERIKAGDIEPDEISENLFCRFLDGPDIPDPDLLIRTSDESRISNFLLWELAYAEIVVSPVLWPDFTKEELRRCISEFSSRTRRFGRTDEQLQSPPDSNNLVNGDAHNGAGNYLSEPKPGARRT